MRSPCGRPTASSRCSTNRSRCAGADVDPIARAEWLRAELGRRHRDARVRDLAVRDLDDVAVLSFVLDPLQAQDGRSGGPPVFAVDAWRRNGAAGA